MILVAVTVIVLQSSPKANLSRHVVAEAAFTSSSKLRSSLKANLQRHLTRSRTSRDQARLRSSPEANLRRHPKPTTSCVS
jgi:hypothetical protein